jgi:ABC-2 type transport system ATP-binding protein
MLVDGTVEEVIAHAKLITWSVKGSQLSELARQLHGLPGIEQAVAFGGVLHVSGSDEQALERSVEAFRRPPWEWTRVSSGLEDVFIHLMQTTQDNFSA